MIPLKRFEGGAGNKAVEALLERWLKRVREQGRIQFGLIVCSENPIHCVSDYAGPMELAYAANWGLDIAKTRLLAEISSKHMIDQSELEKGSQDVRYDMSIGPANYDFLAWLIIAEMGRRRVGAPAPLRVCFTMSDQTAEERELHAKARQDMYDNVIKPSLALVGAIEHPTAINAPFHRRYTFGAIVEACKKGEEVPRFKPSSEAFDAVDEYLGDGPAPVTITLREADYWPHRNSNMPEWIKVARYLEGRGERVIFIRDTAKAFDEIEGFEVCPSAALDLDVRTALYERAKCNLFVSNGPWSCALFGSRPWLMFVETDPMTPFFAETAQFWAQWHGCPPGEQLPWCKPDQRIVWKRDTFETIKEAWEELYGPAIADQPYDVLATKVTDGPDALSAATGSDAAA